jgi:hypothetical protein
MIALPVNQRFFLTRQFTRVVSESQKNASIQGLGSYSVQKLPTDSIGNFSLTLTNVVIGSRIHVEIASTGATVTDLVADATTEVITIPAYSIGSVNNDIKIKVRKATASPYYRPYDTQTTAIVGSASIYVSQQPDE